MPRFTGEDARWESFRRWLADHLLSLDGEEFVIIEAPDGGYVQFINEGSGLLGECCDPMMMDGLAPRATVLDERIRAVGWGPIDPLTESPNYRAQWYADASSAASPFDRRDALDAATLTVETFRQVFEVDDPSVLTISNGEGEISRSDLSPRSTDRSPRVEMTLTPLPKQPDGVSDTYNIHLLDTKPTPVAGPVSLLVVTGRISNVSNEPRSFHISVVGRRELGGRLFNTGLMGQTETPLLDPGQVAHWEAKIAVKDEDYPTSLRYVVDSQERPGQLPVSELTMLEDPSALGSMVHVMMASLAATIAQWDVVAPEEDQAGAANNSQAPREQPVTRVSRPTVASAAAPSAATAETWPHIANGVPLQRWRGLSKMTRKSTVAAFCRSCGHQWRMDSRYSNTLAQEQAGLGARRVGLGMEQFGASMTPFASGRRIAAGNERERLERGLSMTYQLCSCPHCRGVDVLLAK
jgi:hypothetical protein